MGGGLRAADAACHLDLNSKQGNKGNGKETGEPTPIGPFHSTVLDLATTALNAAVDMGPMSRPIKPSAMPSASVAVPTAASAPNLSPVACKAP